LKIKSIKEENETKTIDGNETKTIDENLNSQTNELAYEIFWLINQTKSYERRLKIAKEESEKKSAEMATLEKDFLSSQDANRSLSKHMQSGEDKNMSLASDNVQLSQTATATNKKN